MMTEWQLSGGQRQLGPTRMPSLFALFLSRCPNCRTDSDSNGYPYAYVAHCHSDASTYRSANSYSCSNGLQFACLLRVTGGKYSLKDLGGGFCALSGHSVSATTTGALRPEGDVTTGSCRQASLSAPCYLSANALLIDSASL